MTDKDKDAPQIARTVFVGHAFYGPNDADALGAVISADEIKDLTERGALTGAWKARKGAAAAAEPATGAQIAEAAAEYAEPAAERAPAKAAPAKSAAKTAKRGK
jgi:hypothetical protein